jgi:ketopantoate reductase
VGAVLELGERLGVPMPNTRAVYACTRLRALCQAPPSGDVQ